MKKQFTNYCQHFEHFKASSSIVQEKEPNCKYCLQGNFVWMCLSKGCGVHACSTNNFRHLQQHLEQSTKIKKFHPIFINLATAQIKCIKCRIEIWDLDNPFNQKIVDKQDPFLLRLRLLPSLGDLTTHKIHGQLQNPKGHQRTSKGLVGIFANKYNYTINSAIQFISHSKFIKQVVLQMRINPKDKILSALQEMLKAIDKAQYRAIHSNIISEQIYKEFPQLLGYKRKDPFQTILFLFHLINEATIHYSLAFTPQSSQPIDEWDLFYKKNAINTHHLIYSSISSTISLNYFCPKCQSSSSLPQNIQFLKLNIPKKKRKAKQIEKQLSSHRYTSPVKMRRNSLMNLFKEEEYPITIFELIIELMRSPLHKEVKCQTCNTQLRKMKLHLQKLPDILIMKIARISKQKDTIDETPVQLSTDSLDMGSFTGNNKQSVMYDFESAVCIEKGLFFPILVIGQSNKQKYVIRHQMVQLCKQKMNPYILCYKRRITEVTQQKIAQINDDLGSQRERQYHLPDFWYLQLQNGIQKPLVNQLVCKHNALKPKVQSKLRCPINISKQVYEDLQYHLIDYDQNLSLNSSLRKKSSLSNQHSRIYMNEECRMCDQQIRLLSQRRKEEKQLVLYYDKMKCQNLLYCMVSNTWIQKWSNFLYNHHQFAYMSKGYPMPGPIDNKSLLQGNKCKPKLVKNEDFKVVNIYLWLFLKQVYGGGPQIRYKWNEGKEMIDEHLVAHIKNKAQAVKKIYDVKLINSPKKMLNSSTTISKTDYQQDSSIWQSHQEDICIEEI